MKLEEYDLVLSNYNIIVGVTRRDGTRKMSNFLRKNLFYNKEKQIFINTDLEQHVTLKENSDYEVLSVQDVEILEEATPENVKKLDSSWICPKEKPYLDNNGETLGVLFGIVGIIGNQMIKGSPGWYIIKFKNGKKALIGEYSKHIEKIKVNIGG